MTRISDSICAADITLERHDVKKVQHFFQILEHCVYRVHGAAATAASKVELFDVMSL